MQLRRFRFGRGLRRAARVIAVSEATKRDVESQMGSALEPHHAGLQRARPGVLRARPVPGAQEQQRILERYQIQLPVHPVRRQHPPAQEYSAAGGGVRRGARSNSPTHPVYKDLRLVIIGDTISQYPAVRQAVMKSRVENVVRFLGFVPFETLRCFYESAAGFVFPSRYEGFGLPPLEAMACGTPVVCSNVSSLPEVVGDAAILVNPENVFDIARGISDMLLDEELRARMIRRGREQAARFSWNWTARQVLEIYKDVIGQS